jgi:hypothetical protein
MLMAAALLTLYSRARPGQEGRIMAAKEARLALWRRLALGGVLLAAACCRLLAFGMQWAARGETSAPRDRRGRQTQIHCRPGFISTAHSP